MEVNLKKPRLSPCIFIWRKLFALNPSIDKLYETLTYIAAKTKNWNQLILLSDKAYSKNN